MGVTPVYDVTMRDYIVRLNPFLCLLKALAISGDNSTPTITIITLSSVFLMRFFISDKFLMNDETCYVD